MNLWDIVIRRKTLISMFFIGLTMLGYISYRSLSVEDLPNVESQTLSVSVSVSAESAPEYIESQAVVPLEGAIGTLDGVDEITSSISQRRATITITYKNNVDIRYAQIKLQQVMDNVKTSLPDEFTVTVQSSNTESLTNEFMTLQVRGTGGLDRIRTIVDANLVNEFETIEGIATVEVVGGQQQAVEIILNADALEGYNITPRTVQNLINQGQQEKQYLGQGVEGNQSVPVNLLGTFGSVRDIEDIVVKATGPVFLRDVADIYFGAQEQTTISRVNGKESITVSLVRESRMNQIRLSHETLDAIKRLNRELKSQDIEIVVTSNSAEEIEGNINLIINLALTGAVFAILVLWFFLNNMRLVGVLALAMPISVFTAFNLFYVYHISINNLTLVGMALAVGMLLDCSVVVLENIYRHTALNHGTDRSVVQGTSEVWRALFASTLTTISVFVPFMFSPDATIRLIGEHVGISIISTLVVSLIVALLMVPMVAHSLLKYSAGRRATLFTKVSHRNRVYQIYSVILKTAMRYPAATIFGTLIVFLISIVLSNSLSIDVPTQLETNQFQIYVTMPSGSTLETSDAVATDVESWISDIAEIQDVTTNVYAEESRITLKLKDDYQKINNRSFQAIQEMINDRMEQLRIGSYSLTSPTSSTRYGSAGGGGGGGRNQTQSLARTFGIGTAQEQILVRGNDYETLVTVANAIKYQIDQLETIDNASQVSATGSSPELRLTFDNRLMNLFDIPLSNVSSELSSSQRQVSSTSTFTQGDEEFSILISTSDAEEQQQQQQQQRTSRTIDEVHQIQVQDQSGNPYPLEDLGQFRFTRTRNSIQRVNQSKQVTVTYSFSTDVTATKPTLEFARLEIEDLLAGISIPPGVSLELVQDEQAVNEYYYLVGGALALIFMILASVFESLTTPLVMMFTIPLAAIGALWALMFTGNSITNSNSLIGLLILLGVVVNNGIILIDFTRILRARGFSRSRALMQAGQSRVRPILITAITTIVGMMPLAMGSTETISRIGAPFAITVIGGLSLSTLFTLVFLPTMYVAMESSLEWFRKLSIGLKVFQYLLFAIGVAFIYFNVDSMLWQIGYTVGLLILIPGTIAFLMTTLRQAKTDTTTPSDKLSINVRRLVKIYDSDGRFIREWKKGQRMEAIFGSEKHPGSWGVFASFRWQIPMIAFLVYFTYFYLESHFWQFILVHILYASLYLIVNPVAAFLSARTNESAGRMKKSLPGDLKKILFWGFPALNLYLFHLLGFRWLTLVFILFFWGLPLIIATTSNRLHREKINIMRLKGRFAGLRKNWYQIVMAIPIIGKKKKPFRALNTVSLEIGNGMFGLLGPNGAGKTTIMRTICGILDQNMGKLYINDMDAAEKREELQGLIGYLPQEFGTYENMSAYEFLDYLAILKNINDSKERAERIQFVLNSVHLQDVQDRKIGSFSGGMKQRVGIALTLLHLPRILVVDEPTAGLDPRERIRFRNLLVELSRERIVIFSTHIIEDISSSCNRVAVMHRGTLRYLGEPNAMTKYAEDKVWQFTVPFSRFEELRTEFRIVHHMQIGKDIRIRCLSATSPYEGAIQVKPTLEDAYLWLLGEKVRPEDVAAKGESVA